MTNLMELASRVEAGEGPDRDLDADIQDAVRLGGYKADRDGCSGRLCGTMTRMASDGDGVEWKPLPAFTASLDAAMTLVPEGKESEAMYSAWSAVASKHALHVGYWKRAKDGDYAQELARHVVAFALRARAHQGAAHVE